MRTLENFFKNGLTNNLTNRVFKMVYGKLYEETPAVGGPRKSFHELMNTPHVNQAARDNMLHLMPEEGKGLFGKPVVERSPNEGVGRFDTRFRQAVEAQGGAVPEKTFPTLHVCLEETPEEIQEKVERIAGHSFQSIGRSMRSAELRPQDIFDIRRPNEDDLEKHRGLLGSDSIIVDARTRLRPGDAFTAGNDMAQSWNTGGVVVTATAARKWLYGEYMEPQLREVYRDALWYLAQTDASANMFITVHLNRLHLIRGSDMANVPKIQNMEPDVFERYVKGLRPTLIASSSICTAMRAVRSMLPEAKYVWFDGDLRWWYMDSSMVNLVWPENSSVPVSVLEDAVLEAADRGLMNQPLCPDLA